MTVDAMLSRLIFGTMRMHEHSRSDSEWAEFLAALQRGGVIAAHSSIEYESFDLFCRVLRIAKQAHGAEFRHIVKLANPHFGESGFDPQRLERQVDSYRERLEVSCIDGIQWMWRAENGQEVARRSGFSQAKDEIAHAVAQLKQSGKIRSIGCFPYTPEFADLAIEEAWMDYLVVYRNPIEREYDRHLDAAYANGKRVIALRPFAAGKALTDHSAREALEYCFAHPAVCSAVATFSTTAHLNAAAQAMSS